MSKRKKKKAARRKRHLQVVKDRPEGVGKPTQADIDRGRELDDRFGWTRESGAPLETRPEYIANMEAWEAAGRPPAPGPG